MRVTDGEGLSAVASIVIQAGNTPPVPTIDTPAPALRWAVGQTITFSGRATDREQGAIPASALSWSLIMNHCATQTSCHEHPIQDFAGVAGSSFVAPDHEYPSYLVLRLRATDSGGLQATTTIRLDPQPVDIGFQTNPTGLHVGIGSESVTAAASRTFIVGSRASISAPSPQILAGVTYAFTSWSDGGAQTHTIVAGSGGTTFTANFARAGAGLDPADRVIHTARATARVGNWQAVRTARRRARHAWNSRMPARPRCPRRWLRRRTISKHGSTRRRHVRIASGSEVARPVTRKNNDSVYARSRAASMQPVRPHTASARTPRPYSSSRSVAAAVCRGGDGGQRLRRIGPLLYFASAGTQTIRVQGREDGVSIDQIVISPVTYLNTRPGLARNDATILPEQTGLATSSGDVVLHVAGQATRVGAWQRVDDESAAGKARLENPNLGAAKLPSPLAAPSDYFEVSFNAKAGRPYRLWLRARAHGRLVQQRFGVRAVLGQRRRCRRGDLPHRHDPGDAGRPRRLRRLRRGRVGVAGQRLRSPACSARSSISRPRACRGSGVQRREDGDLNRPDRPVAGHLSLCAARRPDARHAHSPTRFLKA